jgi:hypothetical protein
MNLFFRQYTAVYADVLQPGANRAAAELVMRIGSRNRNCGLRRFDQDPQAFSWLTDDLRDACPMRLTPYADEFLVPAFDVSTRGEPQRQEGTMTLAAAVSMFERCSVAVKSPITSFQILYEQIRDDVRVQVLREQALSAMVQEGVADQAADPPELLHPEIEPSGEEPPARLDAPAEDETDRERDERNSQGEE